MHYEWNITCMQDSLAARLAIQNRTFEGGEMDLLKIHAQLWRDEGDEETALLMEGILSDEIQHVRFANRWIKRLAKDDPGTLLKVLKGVAFMKQVLGLFSPTAGQTNSSGAVVEQTAVVSPPNIEARRLAEFTEEEIADLLRRDGLNPATS